MTTRTSASYRLTLTVGLCFLVALMEGLDLQAAGIAAVGIAHAFALDKMQMGWIFSAGILGLLPGALVGGMLADRYGRKRILIASVALFGLFSLATAISWDFSSLVFARLMTGVGLGAALPNLIALTSEAAGPRFRGTAVSLMYCGVPIGAALAAALGFSGLASAWQTVFWVGGVIPLLLVPLLMRWLPESQVYTQQTQVAAAPLRALFAPATASATLLLWLCYFFTLLVVYMLINWLPMLLVEQGFRPSQAAGVMFALQIGAASGTLILGALMDKLRPVVMSLLIYTGMLASLLALGTVSSLSGMLMAGFVAGGFATRRAKCVVCAGAAVLQHADPRHRRGNRRRSRASGGDERSAAGRENVSARYRNGRGDGGFCAGHFAGRPGGIYSDEPQITDADPGQRCLSIHPVVGVGRFDSHFRVNAVSQLWCQSLDKTWQRRRYELAALFVSDY
ncbi:3-(3-hydroxy-phenyl)propionate transporter MhpT [Escherichia coli]|uniref:3-(3-hydroxy-phenyl)propionate transporter MhpT n=1 Tax=Escherichia coli TaxID=562 RepID=UPI0004D8120C|nr:3-(3-hydroxy-phenyl)propionate transporter MhpT [Escherichia coli]KEN16320.1 sugar (and other) transporter family protein [Escherichia coli 7-233-03_S4_C2]